MNHTPPTNQQHEQRRGFLSMELVLTLPIFGLILCGLLEFSMLFFARGSVVDATRTGARIAAMPGVNAQDVEAQVLRVLAPRLRDSAEVDVILGERSGDTVEVAVRVPMHNAAPNLLWPVGYSLKGRQLYSRTRMVRE